LWCVVREWRATPPATARQCEACQAGVSQRAEPSAFAFLAGSEGLRRDSLRSTLRCERRSEVTTGELSTGPRFEVLLKGTGLSFGPEAYGGLYPPWSVFGGVRHISLVVLAQPGLEVCCASGVAVRWVCSADQDVDVVQFRGWHAKP